MDHLPLSIAIAVLILFSGFFSATETAFSCANKIKLKTLAAQGKKNAKAVYNFADEKYDKLVTAILVGNNVVNILCSSMATVLFVKYLGNELGPSVSTAVTTVVVLIFAEVSPKSIAKEFPEKFAMFSAPLLKCLVLLLTPFNFLFGLWKKLLSLIFKAEEDSGITEEEFLSIVEEAEQDGGIDEQESMIIQNAMEFTELLAMDILTPRIDITGVSTTATKEEIAEVFTETAYSRLPLYEDNIDHIVGIIYHKDFHNHIYNTDKGITSIIRPAIFVPKTKKVGVLLKELQQKKSHIAVVLDEYGGTVGIITLEDILEELVGEIWDEHDEVSQDIIVKSETEYIMSGNTHVEKVFECLELELVEEEANALTLNGWIMNRLGKVPEHGDVFTYENIEFRVVKMDDKRVEKVLVIKEQSSIRE